MMILHEWVQHALNYVHQHPEQGLWITLLVSFIESLPLLGTLIPGSLVMTAVGTLVGTGLLPLGTTLLLAALGALIGDVLSFFLGFLLDSKVRRFVLFRKHPKWLKASEDFFQRHGGKSILIGRFVGPARSTVPLVAGLCKMSWPLFLIVVIPTAFLWAVVYMLPGVVLGAISATLPAHKMTAFLVMGLLLVAALWFCFWVLQKLLRKLLHLLNGRISGLWNFLNQHHGTAQAS